MEKYKGYECGKTYLVSNEKDAKRSANKVFKTKLEKIQMQVGYVLNDELYLKKVKGGVPVYVYTKE